MADETPDTPGADTPDATDETEPPPSPVPTATVTTGESAGSIDFDGLIRSIADECHWEHVTHDDGSVELTIETDAGRKQKVTVRRDEDIAAQPLARFWSTIGPAQGLNYLRLLRENADLDYGTFAIRDEMLVLVDTQLIEDADPLEVGTSLSYLASYADRYESAIFGVDSY